MLVSEEDGMGEVDRGSVCGSIKQSHDMPAFQTFWNNTISKCLWVAGVVVGDAGGDRDLLADRTDGPALHRGFLLVVALGLGKSSNRSGAKYIGGSSHEVFVGLSTLAQPYSMIEVRSGLARSTRSISKQDCLAELAHGPVVVVAPSSLVAALSICMKFFMYHQKRLGHKCCLTNFAPMWVI